LNATITPISGKNPAPFYEKLLTPAEVGAAFRVDPKSVTRWAKRGILSSTRTLGGHRRFFEAEVLAMLRAGRQERTK
jgi:predicted site-specific integrase-resolvase